MLRFTQCCQVAFFAAVFAPLVWAQEKIDPRTELATAIPEMIRLLEAKDYIAFIKTYSKPDTLKEVIKSGATVEQVAEGFRQELGARALADLKAAQKVKPEISADGKKATYRFKNAENPNGGGLTFVKVDRYWHIAD